jgi:hypothetical protein
MAKADEHARLIAAAAKAALQPLGFVRQGRSRFWFADQRFWIIFAEFQPSSWSKGSYLNMGVKWLWQARPTLDISYRPVDFIPFESKEQFAPLIGHMAEVSAQEALKLRAQFKSLADVSQYLVAHASSDGWPVYHAAIASGLTGDVETSKRLFERMEAWSTYGYDWELELKAESAAFAALLCSPEQFRSAISAIIDHTRRTMKMAPDPGCLEINRPSVEP